MNSLLSIEGWDKQGRVLSVKYYSSSKKWLDQKATEFHNEIPGINKAMLNGSYNLQTRLIKQSNNKGYVLKVRVKYYENKRKK